MQDKIITDLSNKMAEDLFGNPMAVRLRKTNLQVSTKLVVKCFSHKLIHLVVE